MKFYIGRFLKLILLNFILLATLLFFLEIIYRLLKGQERIYRNDGELGWAPKENVIISGKIKRSFKGRYYKSNYSTNNIGIRSLKNKYLRNEYPTKPLKILTIGDSFIGDNHASNEDSWFGVLQNLSQGAFRVYAYGIGGSGTSQQFRAFNKLQSVIRPDILLIQYCVNDPLNDSFEYGKRSIIRNQDLRRPYYKNGEFYFREDSKSKLYRLLYKSYLFQKVDLIITNLQFKIFNDYIPKSLSSNDVENILNHWEYVYTNYVQHTKANGINDIWTISCAPSIIKKNEPYFTRWKEVSEKLDVKVFHSFSKEPYSAHLSGKDIFLEDGNHLNDIGNEIAGEALYQEISDYLK